jgi:hypothetical protein
MPIDTIQEGDATGQFRLDGYTTSGEKPAGVASIDEMIAELYDDIELLSTGSEGLDEHLSVFPPVAFESEDTFLGAALTSLGDDETVGTNEDVAPIYGKRKTSLRESMGFSKSDKSVPGIIGRFIGRLSRRNNEPPVADSSISTAPLITENTQITSIELPVITPELSKPHKREQSLGRVASLEFNSYVKNRGDKRKQLSGYRNENVERNLANSGHASWTGLAPGTFVGALERAKDHAQEIGEITQKLPETYGESLSITGDSLMRAAVSAQTRTQKLLEKFPSRAKTLGGVGLAVIGIATVLTHPFSKTKNIDNLPSPNPDVPATAPAISIDSDVPAGVEQAAEELDTKVTFDVNDGPTQIIERILKEGGAKDADLSPDGLKAFTEKIIVRYGKDGFFRPGSTNIELYFDSGANEHRLFGFEPIRVGNQYVFSTQEAELNPEVFEDARFDWLTGTMANPQKSSEQLHTSYTG